MFCSKCGKEIQEGAAFCSSCGQPLQNGSTREANNVQPQVIYVNQPNSGIMSCPPDEKQKKSTVVILFFIKKIIGVFFILCFLTTKLEFLSYFLDTKLSHTTLVEILKVIYKEGSAILWCLAIFSLLVPIIEGIVLWNMYKNRNFASRKINFGIGSAVMDSIFWLFLPILVNICVSETSKRYNFDFGVSSSILFWAVVIIIAAFNIAYGVAYQKASDCEETNVYYEKQKQGATRSNEQKAYSGGTSYWICQSCRTSNSGKDMFCQKCGKNKGEGTESDGWKCKSCQTLNNKNAPFCKNCGKYK